MSAMIGSVTRDRYDELVKLGRDWVATMSSAQWRLGDAAVEIEPMRSYGGANPSGKDDLFTDSEAIRMFAEDVGLAYTTVRSYRWVSSRWPKECRRADVSHTIHKVLASVPDEQEPVRHLHAHLPRVLKDQAPGQPQWKRCGHGPGQLHPGDQAVVDAFKKMLSARRTPAPWTEGDEVAVQVPNGVERARTEPGQTPGTDIVDLVLIHPDTGEVLTGPMPCPRTLILGPWDDTFRPLTHVAVGQQLPDSAMSEPILSHLAGQPSDGRKEA
ncbi:DUF6192 family protein [Streptomyces sp. NBC_01483]|uniref:DUF6192 family protein n=1 Tax=Streptomyces sp. NBC_01483 TaxID=2903883 RepID=UPI002E372FAD|nr:DUF6192 family protein [Streptomyces sp. NBC_01483]